MTKRKYVLFCTLTLVVAILIVIFHIPFFTLILGEEKVFNMRGLFLIVITPLIIVAVSIVASIIINKLTKVYKRK